MPPRARNQKPKAEPVAEPTPVEAAEPVVDEPTPAPADVPETVEEFRVRATFPNGATFLVRSGRVYASREDADGAVFVDQRRYRWAHAPAAPEYVVESRTVTRSPWS